MIDTVLPPLVAAAAILLTYLFCVRPMMKGRGCHMTPQQSQAGQASCHSTTSPREGAQPSLPDGTDAEIRRLREEVRLLHHELDLRATEPFATKPFTTEPFTDAVRLQKDDSH